MSSQVNSKPVDGIVAGGRTVGDVLGVGSSSCTAVILGDSAGTGTVNTIQIATSGSLDTSSAGALNIGLTSGGNATSINLNQDTTIVAGKSISFASGAGNFDQHLSSGTFQTGTGAVSLNGDTTIAANKNLTLTSGTGVITQNFATTATNSSGFTQNVTNNSASGANQTVAAQSIQLTGHATSGSNVNIGLAFQNVTTVGSNFFYGLNFGTGYNDLLRYNGTQLISGTGKLQNAALDSTLAYTNITGVGALTSGSIASGFGTISTGNNITTTATLQGGTIQNTGGSFAVDSSGHVTAVLSGTTGTTLVCQNGSSVLSACDSSYIAPTAGNFIQNQNASTQTANFKISGTGTANTIQISTGGSLDTSSAGAINIGLTSGGNATSINLNQNVNIAAGKNITFGSTGNFDQSASSGTFATGTGNVSLNGNTTVASGKTLTAGGGNFQVDTSGNVTAGTYNTSTLNGTNLTFGNNSSAATIASGTNQNLTVQANGTGTLNLNTGGAGTVNLATANSSQVNIGNTSAGFSAESNGTANLFNGATAHTIQIGTGGAVQTITLGSTNSTSTTLIQGGSGTSSGSEAIRLIPAAAGAITLGGTSQTGAINIGVSTASNTINIGAGATASGNTQTIHIGDGGAAGSTTNVTIGSSVAGTTVIQGQTAVRIAKLTTNGLVYTSGGNGTLNSGALDRNSSTYFNTTLSVSNGGTGATTFTGNGILYGNGTGAIQDTASANNSVLVTDGSGNPSLSQTLPSAVQGNITSVGTISSGTWQGTTIATNHGGTGLTSFTSNGVFYASSTSAISQTTGSGGQILLSNAGVPTFTTLSGDISSVSSAGSVTIANGAITSAKIFDGTIADADLSTGTFTHVTGTGTLSAGSIAAGFGTIVTQNTSANALQIQSASGADTMLTVDTTARSASGGNLIKIGNSTGTDTNTTILQLDSASSDITSNTSALNGGLYYKSGANNGFRGVVNGTVVTICDSTGNCNGAGTTLQTAYNNSIASPEIKLNTTNGGLTIQDADTTIGSTANLFEILNAGGGTNLFKIQGNGNVGIGTSGNPSQLFSVGGSTGNFTVNSSGNIVTSGTTQLGGAVTINNTTALNGQVTINSGADNVGLIVKAGSASQTANIFTVTDHSGNLLSGFDANGSLILNDTTSNFVGTISVQANSLSANRTIFFPNTGGTICTTSGNCIGNGGSGDVFTGGQAGPLVLGTTNNTDFTLITNNTQGVIIKNSGKVGIGSTINPSQLFSVGGATGAFTVDNSGNIVTSGTYNGNTFTNNQLTFSAASSASIQAASGQNLNIDSGNSGTLNLGTSSTTASIVIGRSGITTNVAGTLESSGGFQVDANQNVTLQNGTGVFTQNYTNSTGSGSVYNVANSSTAGGTVNGLAVNLSGTNATGSNIVNGINFGNASNGAGGTTTFNGLNFGTGYTNLLTSANVTLASAGTLSLSNAGTSSTISITTTGNPGAGSALIFANNNSTTPSSNLIELQNKGTDKFTVDVSGNTVVAGTLKYTDSGASATSLVCKDGSGLLSACNTTGTGAAFVQGGNNFGADAVLGANQSGQQLTFMTGGSNRLTLDATGANLNFLQAAQIGTNSGNNNFTVQANGTGILALNTGGAGTVALGDTNSTTINIGRGSDIARTISIGTGGSATNQTIQIGSTNNGSTVLINSGGGVANGDINIDDNTTASKRIDIGSVDNSGTTTVNIATASGSQQQVSIGSANSSSTLILEGGTSATAIQIGNGATAHGIQIGHPSSGTTAQNIFIGSATNSTSTLSLQGGTSTSAGTAAAITLNTGVNGGVAGTISIGNVGAVTQEIDLGVNTSGSSATSVFVGSTQGGVTVLNSANIYLGNADSTGKATTPATSNLKGVTSNTAGTVGGSVNLLAGAGASTGTGSAGGALSLAGGAAGTPTTTGNASAGGNVSITGGAAGGLGSANANGGNVTINGGAKFGATGTVGAVQLQTSDGALTIGSGSTSATSTIQIGATTGTAAITLGQTTDTNTISIGDAATASGKTQTINIGHGGLSGSTATIHIGDGAGTSNITIGSTTAGATTLQSAAGTLISSSNGTVYGAKVTNAVNPTVSTDAAFIVDNTSGTAGSGNLLIAARNNGTNKFTVDAAGNVVALGGAAISGAATTINNNSNFNTSINTGTSTGTVSIGSTTNSGNFTLESGTAETDLFNSNTAHTIKFATGSAAQTITIGSTNTSSSVKVQGGANYVNVSNTGVGINVTAANPLAVNALTTASSAYQVAVSTGGISNNGVLVQGVASQSSSSIYLGVQDSSANNIFQVRGDDFIDIGTSAGSNAHSPSILFSSTDVSHGGLVKAMVVGTGGISANDVVVFANDGGNARVLDTTTTNDSRVFGVALSGASAGGTANIATYGFAVVKYTGTAPAIGDILVTSTTGGSVKVDNFATKGILGYATTAGSGGTVGVVINPVGGAGGSDGNSLVQVPASNTAGASGANVISPTVNSITGLTINGTTGTAATAEIINQAQNAVGLQINGSSSSNSAALGLSSTSVTSGNIATISQSTSTYSGTALLLNMANGSGTFSGKFVDLQVNGTSKFTVDANGIVTLVGGNGTSGDIKTANATGATNSLNILTGNSTTSGATGAITIQSGNATSGASGNVTIDTGTYTSGTPTINIGTTSAKTINVGNATATTTLQLEGATVTIGNSANAHTVQIATGGAVQGVTVGSTNSTSTLNLQSGTGTGTGDINIDDNTNNSKIIDIGSVDNAGSTTIRIATNASSTQTITIGSNSGSSAVNLQSGTSNISLLTNGGASSTTGTLVKSVTNNSTLAFQVQNASSNSLFTVDTATGTGVVTIGFSGNAATFSAGGGLRFSGTARNTKTIALSPEFVGAVFNPDGSNNVGTLTAGIDTGTGRTYYNWTTTQSSAQDYDMYVRVAMPRDWAAWNTNTNNTNIVVCYNVWTDDSTPSNSVVTSQLFDTANASAGTFTATPTSASTWQQKCSTTSYNAAGTNTFTVNGNTYIVFDLHFAAAQNKNTRISDLTMDYLSQF